MYHNKLFNIWLIFVAQWRHLLSRPVYMVLMLAAPVFTCYFFVTLMLQASPTDMPVAVVDADGSKTSRTISHNLDAFMATSVSARAKDFSSARLMVQKGQVYGIYSIPQNFERDLLSSRQPTLAFYTNSAFMVPASLQMSDMTTISALSAGSVGRSVLLAKGATNAQAQALLQPTVLDVYPLHNPGINYMFYLAPMLIYGVYNVIIMLLTGYVMGMEVKYGMSRTLLRLSGGNIMLALAAKLFPITLTFCLVCFGFNALLFCYLGVPCACGVGLVNLLSCLLVLASQSIAIFLYGLFPIMRLSLSITAIFSVLSVSFAGFTFPYEGFPQFLKAWPLIMPLRHFFVVYVCEAFNGYGLYYCIGSVVALLAFLLLPLLVMKRIKRIYEEMVYEL